jgi:iron complex outermembrane receptor protein
MKNMNSDCKLASAIAVILAGGTPCLTRAASVAVDAPDSIEEITVTAQRRSENIQDVPIAIQALTGETLAQLNVRTFDDLTKYLPNVSIKSNGPAQGMIYMRGLSSGGSSGNQSSGTIGAFPNVAIYLDDQSGQLTGRNLDIYAADLERVEVLEGPQGTLFGAGAQAGVIRYITNKPKLDVTAGEVSAGYSTTAHGANNSNVTAMINLPLIADTLAVRAVIYNDSRGGYIDNVPGTFTRKSSDLGIFFADFATACAFGAPSAAGLCTGAGNSATSFGVPPGSQAINNASLVADDINPVTYQGIRAAALYQIDDDWNVLIEQTYQEIYAQGVFYQMPNSSDGTPLGPLQVTLFTPSFDTDKFENTAWSVNGKVGDLRAVYTGSYLVRNVNQVQDYTNYARGLYADYYQCHGANAAGTLAATCYSPASTWREQERNTHQSQEIRVSTPDNWRGRGVAGAFWEDLDIYDQSDWQFKSLPACTLTVTLGCLTDIYPAPGSTTTNPAVRSDSTSFFEDVQRGYKQYAFFISMDFDVIPNVLTVTGGTRYYRFTNTETGTVVSSFGCYEAGPAPCLSESGTNINAENLRSANHGFKSRANLSWHPTESSLLYYTWSQGFRPGGFNRRSGCHVKDTNGIDEFCIPLAYAPDTLTNNELGWKTEFFGHRFQWNGALYQENWNNVQVGFYDPGQLGDLFFGTNGQDFRIRGVETSIVARLTQELSLVGGAAWNSSEQTNSPYLIANNPALLASPASAAEFGKPITALANPFGPPGAPSANSPPIQANLRIRYDLSFNGYRSFAQIGGSHTGHSFTQTGSNPSLSEGGSINTTLLRFENPAYSTFDASLGVAKDAWNVAFFGENITDKNASLFTSTSQFVETQTVIRPRVLGMQFGYKF